MDYISIKNEIINNLRPLLIESFVEFYGENYRTKIEEIITKMIVVSFEKNMTDEDLKTEIQNTKEDNLLKKTYYELVKKSKENSNDVHVYLASTSSKEDAILRAQVKEVQDKKIYGWTDFDSEEPIVYLRGFLIDIMTLIHEINHFLSKEKLGKLSIEGTDITFDVTHYAVLKDRASFDLVYEIFNELMSLEILEIFTKKCQNTQLLDLKIKNSPYLELDKYCLNVVSDIYSIMKDLIKNRLIVGNGFSIMKIFGYHNYARLNIFLGGSMNELQSTLASDESLYIDDCTKKLSDEEVENLIQIKTSIENMYNQHLECQNNLNACVDELVADGKAIRIN